MTYCQKRIIVNKDAFTLLIKFFKAIESFKKIVDTKKAIEKIRKLSGLSKTLEIFPSFFSKKRFIFVIINFFVCFLSIILEKM